jgi:hypothetical protein
VDFVERYLGVAPDGGDGPAAAAGSGTAETREAAMDAFKAQRLGRTKKRPYPVLRAASVNVPTNRQAGMESTYLALSKSRHTESRSEN